MLECSHHGFEKICLIKILYDGLEYPNKTMIEFLYNGAFTSKIANDVWKFFKEVAENTLEWELVSVDVKQPTQLPSTWVVCIDSTTVLRMMLK